MKVGDYVRCVRSNSPKFYTVGCIYLILDFDFDGDPIFESNTGEIGGIGCPLDGLIWGFEVVDESDQTLELLEFLRLSEEDVKAGRVMTREQLLERLSK